LIGQFGCLNDSVGFLVSIFGLALKRVDVTFEMQFQYQLRCKNPCVCPGTQKIYFVKLASHVKTC